VNSTGKCDKNAKEKRRSETLDESSAKKGSS
jgi:hypothetical protein